MAHDEQIMQMIYEAIDEVNEEADAEGVIEKSPDTVLIGESAQLDSMGFVTFIATVEDGIAESFGAQIELMDIVEEEGEWTVTALTKYLADAIAG